MAIMKSKTNFTQDLLKTLFTYNKKDGGLDWAVQTGSRNLIGNRFGYQTPSGYRKGIVMGKTVREHRLIWIYFNGDIPVIEQFVTVAKFKLPDASFMNDGLNYFIKY